ncbi:MBL fold metallo-hydrolase [Peterkaempfera sp. SMS 1(5)a]|uniref:MBL fold metallo-hydrolase n=1 Tax=Peterkaempfera podocarpi TaxID=3232308 RepID=UPI003673375E
MASASQSAPPTPVRPGLWALPLPLPVPPRSVTVYVLETDAGPWLIDAGWDTEDAWQTLTAGLSALGTGVEDVRGVLVTHSHLDHYGMAPRIREASGAPIALHPLDAAQLPRYREDPAERLAALLRRAGAPPAAVDQALAEAGRQRGHRADGPDVLLEDGHRPQVPGGPHRPVDPRSHPRAPVLLGRPQPAAARRRPGAAPHRGGRP